MQNTTMNLIKGIGIGMLAGAAATITVKTVLSDDNSIAKGSTKVIKAAGQIVDGIQTMFK